MEVNSIGIIGYGHFGEFIHTLSSRFVPEAEVRVYSRSGKGGDCATSLEDTAAADVVFLCAPISAYESTVREVVPHLGPTSILVDVATVKKHTTELFQKELSDKQWFSCHPMFGQESYKKTDGNITGYRIVVTDHTLPDEVFGALRDWLLALGFLVIEMSADEHDKHLADTLFMTHYIGQIMSSAGFARTEIDTVSFQSLMNAVEAVAQDGKLFRDVYNYNPYCEQSAVRFHDAQEVVLKGLLKSDGRE